MKRFKVHLGEEADADISGIFTYIHENGGSVRTAQSFVDRILARCTKIGDIPFGGRPRDDLMIGLRTIPFERATIIAYRIVDETVEILNVFYGGRDYEALYRDDGDDAPSA